MLKPKPSSKLLKPGSVPILILVAVAIAEPAMPSAWRRYYGIALGLMLAALAVYFLIMRMAGKKVN